MEQVETGPQTVTMRVRNIGGINETTVQFQRGVTALVGENATNRTSLLQALAAGLGTDSYTLKSDAERGEVELTLDNQQYVREIRRDGDRLRTDGDGYLDDPNVAELFAVLLEHNDVRQAVREGRDLRDLILDPVDTESIRQQIADHVDRRREIDRELDRLDRLDEERSELEGKRTRLQNERETLETDLTEARNSVATEQTDDQSDADQRLQETLDRVDELRTELDRVTDDLERETKSLDSLRDTRATVEQQYETQTPPSEAEIARLEERLDGLRERRRSLDATITELQRVIRFNEEQLDGSESLLRGEFDTENSLTEQLNPAESTVTCWTCGSTVERRSIETMVDTLRTLRQQKTEEKNDISTQIQSLGETLDQLQTDREEYETLEERLTTLETEIEQSEQTVSDLESRRETLESRIEDLESTADELQETQEEELLAARRKVNELEYEKGRVENELDSVQTRIENIEAELDARADLRDEREQIVTDLAELRTRIERIEREAVDAFNTHMNELLDILDYDNIDRIWLEQREADVQQGRQQTTQQTFDLHVVRSTDGTVYEDTVENLSESEREITGIVVALAGYLVHDVHDTVPFMLLDSIEMIDGNRLVDLVSYLEPYIPYLVVVLLPDHARAFEQRGAAERHRLVEV